MPTSPDGKWPILYNDVLEVGNKMSNVSLCTLWTHREAVSRTFEKNDFAIIGNLYGTGGISPIIRNVFANPYIRYIVLWGNDLSGSGDAFVEFMKHGVNGDLITPSGTVLIEKEIGRDAANRFRDNVSFIDLRGRPLEQVKETIKRLPVLPPFCEPTYFPLPKTTRPDSYPSEQSGFRVVGKSVAETWLQVIYSIMRFGFIKRTKYGNTNELRELYNLTAIINDEDSFEEYIPDYLPFDRQQLNKYYPQVVEPQHVEGASYSYGERLRNHSGIDQIAAMIERLKQNRDSKRMFATTWNVAIDTFSKEDVPCLTQVNGGVQGDRFFLTAHFRSQDMYGGWPLNAFSMRRLQTLIATEAGLSLGPLTMITHSAHIYSWDWGKSQQLVKEYRKIKRPASEIDPRGYIIIRVIDKVLEVGLYSYENKLLDTIAGKTARSVGLEIVRRMWTTDAGHALYLGRELQKAENAAQMGVQYTQDKSLDIYREAQL